MHPHTIGAALNPGFAASYMALPARGTGGAANPGLAASYMALRARGMVTVSLALGEEVANRGSDFSRVVGQVPPGEADNPPTVQEGFAVPVPIAFKGIEVVVPPTRIPLDGKFRFGIGSIEATNAVPRHRVLKHGLWQSEIPKHGCAQPLQRCAIPGTFVAFGEHPPHLGDTRLATASYLVDDGPHIVDLHTALDDQ